MVPLPFIAPFLRHGCLHVHLLQCSQTSCSSSLPWSLFLSLHPFLDMAAYTCICSSPVRPPAARLCHGPCFLWPPSAHMPSLFLFENQSYTLFKSQLKLNLLEASRSHSSAVISVPFGPFQSSESLLCILPLFSVLPGVSLCMSEFSNKFGPVSYSFLH